MKNPSLENHGTPAEKHNKSAIRMTSQRLKNMKKGWKDTQKQTTAIVFFRWAQEPNADTGISEILEVEQLCHASPKLSSFSATRRMQWQKILKNSMS